MVDVQAEKIALDQQIKEIQREIDNNLSLTKNQIMEKKRLVNNLIAKKNKL